MTPRATYRFQFNEKFTLKQARALVPYLHELGISHVYASPLFKARPHSTHGYDTCDFNQLNPELGTEADMSDLVEALHARQMGLVLDVVPNHMGIGGPENHWWWDVLSRGPESPFARYFDIDWRAPDPRLRGKVLLPVLGDRYQRVLEEHKLKLEKGKSQDSCLLRYGDNIFPINAPSLKAAHATREEINDDPAVLDALIEKQHYRLAWYGRGDSELNYRRFCNISTLPGLCMEDELVFNQVFGLTRKWLERGWLDGLRVDHIDGLRDPQQFLQRLQTLAPKAWITVEKILERDEALPPSWLIGGTTGYDFLNFAAGLFVDPRGEKPLSELYLVFTGNTRSYPALAREKKRLVLRTLLATEVDHLTGLLLRSAASDSRHRDFTKKELSTALIEWCACFPVYRSYARPSHAPVDTFAASQIAQATDEARRSRVDLPPELFGFFSDLLLLKQKGDAESEFVSRFQELTAAAMAKGVEDTAFYCYNRFAALNEVGGNPGRFGCSADEFHQFCLHQQANWPFAMLATSTHDTKRSEDVRARLSLLSEIPGAWRDAVSRWSDMNQRHHRHGWPDANAEYLYYQTLVGAWPLSVERAIEYMDKAAHEAKEFTRHGDAGNAEYDKVLREFITASLSDRPFLADVENFVTPLFKPACINSLAQTLLKLAAPGVPDFYQGTELWEFSLVDPDNRRPVDFKLRQKLMAQAESLSAEEAWQKWLTGLPKLWLIRRVLGLRARRPDLFGEYKPLSAPDHIVAFQRGQDLMAVVPRLVLGMWPEAKLELPAGRWRNELTGEVLPQKPVSTRALLDKFPVALLAREANK